MSSSISTVNRIERNIKRNTMLFIIQHLRKTSENFVIILNLLKKLSDIEFNVDDETKIVSDFNNFKKTLLSFSKESCGTTLSIYSKHYIEHDIFKRNMDLYQLSNDLYNSLNRALKNKIKNIEYQKKYIEYFQKFLNEIYEVVYQNLKFIKNNYPNNNYLEELEKILEIIKFVKKRFKNQ